jgi:zinc protease
MRLEIFLKACMKGQMKVLAAAMALVMGTASAGNALQNFLDLISEDKPLDGGTIAAKRYMAMTAVEIQTAFKQDVRPDGFITTVKGPAPK